ncbi:MAG: hypothetical protein HY717_15940 [Planctomycetes bacterium]|nr:hypothetical protein [Planctomycetota bacterium]
MKRSSAFLVQVASPGLAIALFCWFLCCGCTGGSSSSSSSATVGISLPSEISAVSSTESGSGAQPAPGSNPPRGTGRILRSLLDARAGSLPADSDYNTAIIRKFVEIPVLDEFDIIEQIFDAARQTHYADAGVVNSGPYKAMVAWEDEGQGGVTITQLQTWTVDSSMITVNGAEVNQVHVWVEEIQDGQVRTIRVELIVEQAPTENADGTLLDLGKWSINAVFGDSTDHFYADADIMPDGSSRLRILDLFTQNGPGGPITTGMKSILFRSADSGYGVIQVPDWEACFGPSQNCPPPDVTIQFAYNSNYLSVVKDGVQSNFDRNDEHTIIHKYKIYRATDGKDVESLQTFGFPVTLSGNQFGWYGSFNGRHQLWVAGQAVPDGTAVTRADVPPSQTAPSYTTRTFSGALTKRTKVAGSLDQIKDIPLEIWLFRHIKLIYSSADSQWKQCIGDDGMGSCTSLDDFTSQLPTLEYSGSGDQRNIFISHCDMNGCTNYVYVTSPSAGFFEAVFDNNSNRWQSNGTPYTPSDNDQLFIDLGGRTYIEYTGEFTGPTTTGWVEKTLTNFDTSTWTPEFDDNADREFFFEIGRELFVNNKGQNFILEKVSENGDANDYDVYMEVQTVANPDNFSTVVPDGTVFVEPWDPAANSTYVLETDSLSPNFLLLKYSSVSSQDQNNGISAGDVVQRDIWGLRSQSDGALQFNWEYQANGEFWGGVTYLLDSNSQFVLLSDPVRFDPIALPRTDQLIPVAAPQSEWLSYNLWYDGHMGGLPDIWEELRKNGFAASGSTGVLGRNVIIPDGTELTETGTSSTYLTLAVDVGLFLGIVNAMPLGAPDLTLTVSIDLDNDLPTYTANDVSTTIPDAELWYVEGIPISTN